MRLKVLGISVMLLGLAMIAVAGLAYRELHNAAKSELAPSADALPLTRLLYPKLFDTGNGDVKAADLAQGAFNRIFIIGCGSFVLVVVGILIVVLPQGPRIRQS